MHGVVSKRGKNHRIRIIGKVCFFLEGTLFLGLVLKETRRKLFFFYGGGGGSKDRLISWT